ncbi:hypothetical protein F2Q69_00014633 [Brassica cretica]|uniref:At2g35280-like TPR domain-containing protein n=1 Tax=Brassica cretica TaxID=69181 RepID=A0A8S9R1C7_BRACR|nr:hypothetical protein F2Q69_00014633 [Brassica cretica]
MPSSLLKSCYAEGNPSTLHIKGVQWFFSFGFKEEGFSLMKHAADAGYVCAVYTHAMTRAIFWCDGQYFAGIPRESVQRIAILVRSVKWGWVCSILTSSAKIGPCSFQLIFCRSTVANVQHMWSDNVFACGTLM